MNSRSIKLSGSIARPDGSLLRGHLNFTDRITSLDPDTHVGDDYILPGFIDLQVNGSHGIDVMSAPPDMFAVAPTNMRETPSTWVDVPVIATPAFEPVSSICRE